MDPNVCIWKPLLCPGVCCTELLGALGHILKHIWDSWPTLLLQNYIPEGPSTQNLRSLVPSTLRSMVLGARNLKYWVLGPRGYGATSSPFGFAKLRTLPWSSSMAPRRPRCPGLDRMRSKLRAPSVMEPTTTPTNLGADIIDRDIDLDRDMDIEPSSPKVRPQEV